MQTTSPRAWWQAGRLGRDASRSEVAEDLDIEFERILTAC